MQELISGMVCDASSSPLCLTQDDLLHALQIKGEFFVLKLHYNDFEDELQTEKIKYKISQSLSVVVSYEDDGTCFENIDKFAKYMYDISDEKQSLVFGVKKVEKLSSYPITILFSGILPINQLEMNIGQKIYDFIHSDDKYFIPKFKQLRDAISKEVNIPILPLFAKNNPSLDDYTVQLKDPVEGKIIAEFEVTKDLNKENLQHYLLKLFYIYKTLLQK